VSGFSIKYIPDGKLYPADLLGLGNHGFTLSPRESAESVQADLMQYPLLGSSLAIPSGNGVDLDLELMFKVK